MMPNLSKLTMQELGYLNEHGDYVLKAQVVAQMSLRQELACLAAKETSSNNNGPDLAESTAVKPKLSEEDTKK